MHRHLLPHSINRCSHFTACPPHPPPPHVQPSSQNCAPTSPGPGSQHGPSYECGHDSYPPLRYLRIAALSRDGVGLGQIWSVHAVGPHLPSSSHQLLHRASWRLGQWCRLAEPDLAQAFEAAPVAFSIAVGSGCLGPDLARRDHHTLRLDHLDWLHPVCSECYRRPVSVVAVAAVVVRRHTGSGRSLQPPGPVD